MWAFTVTTLCYFGSHGAGQGWTGQTPNNSQQPPVSAPYRSYRMLSPVLSCQHPIRRNTKGGIPAVKLSPRRSRKEGQGQGGQRSQLRNITELKSLETPSVEPLTNAETAHKRLQGGRCRRSPRFTRAARVLGGQAGMRHHRSDRQQYVESSG